MHRHMKYALVAVALTFPNLALAETGAAGAVVGGPVGAAVGAGVGGVVGGAASGPDQQNVTIEHRNVESTGSAGCTTTTKQRTDAFGDTTTKQKTEC
jgi:hypothetical protein